MRIDAVIFGASGYGGGELLYWLSRHPQVRSIRGTSRTFDGKPFSAAHPHLRSVLDGQFESDIDWQGLARSEQPVGFSALPHRSEERRVGKECRSRLSSYHFK